MQAALSALALTALPVAPVGAEKGTGIEPSLAVRENSG